MNFFRNISSSTESTDGKIDVPRPWWKRFTRQMRNLFSRNRQTYPINSRPRLPYPKITLTYQYDMNHEKRGLAVIFNHKYFGKVTGFGTRIGTEVDHENLTKTLQKLDFTIESHNDLKKAQVFEELERSKNFFSSDGEII